jgi:H/ACA ribonucleoprotein complex subunit 1
MVTHDCESELLVRSSLPDKVPYFNAGVYLENKKKIGKVDEILGKINEVYFTVKMDPGVVAKSFQPKDLVYIGTDKLLPLARFTNPSKPGESIVPIVRFEPNRGAISHVVNCRRRSR